MAKPSSPTTPDESREQRPSRSAKSLAMANAKWIGAARQGRKRHSSTSPPRGSHSAKSKKKTKLAQKPNSAAPNTGAKKIGKGSGSQAISRKPRRMAASNDEVPHQPKVSRKQPVAIVSDDEDEELSEASPSESDGRHHRNQVQETDDEGMHNSSSEEGQSDEGDFDDGAEGLQELDGRSLMSTLRSEHARWSSKPQNHITPDVELTTASEVDGRPIEDDEDSQSEEEKHQNKKVARHQAYKASKRDLARLAEVPRFPTVVHPGKARTPKVTKSFTIESEGSSDDDASIAYGHDINEGWDPSAHLIPPQSGARIISIKAQSPALQAVVKAAIRDVTGDALFSTTYPSPITVVDYICDTLRTNANRLNFSALSDRFAEDRKFVETISRVLAVRLSNIRCGFKKVAAAEVKGFYSLIAGDSCRDRIKHLISSTEYIYPVHATGLLWRTKPFQHPCIISVLKEFVFTSTRGMSLAEKHSQRFTSSIQQGQQATELEVPIAMVCAAATAVQASLDDWSDGRFKKTEFNADFYDAVYKGHEDFLLMIQKDSPAQFHRLMANIYNDVSPRHAQQAAAVTNNAMALLDIEEMEV